MTNTVKARKMISYVIKLETLQTINKLITPFSIVAVKDVGQRKESTRERKSKHHNGSQNPGDGKREGRRGSG